MGRIREVISMAAMSYEEEQELIERCEFELYQALVHIGKEMYEIQEGQTELSYEQRMLYLYTEKKTFSQMENDLEGLAENKKPSELLKEKYMEVVDAYILKEEQAAAFSMLDRYLLFASRRSSREGERQSRSKRFYLSAWALNKFFESFKKHMPLEQSEHMVALLLGDEGSQKEEGEAQVEEKLKDILAGKSTARRPEWEARVFARGIVLSQNEKLIAMLMEQVKTKKLKEDFRWELCHEIAQGTIENFLLLFQTLVENDMAKFRSVRRLVAEWTGLYEKKTLDQITNDTLKDIWKALTEQEYRKQLLESNDSRSIYLGIWAEGCRSLENAMEIGKELLKSGSAQGKAAAAYYSMIVEMPHFSTELVEIHLEQFEGTQEDNQLLAVLLCSYLRNVETTTGSLLEENLCENNSYGTLKSMLPERKPLCWQKYFVSEEQARKHFSLLKKLYETMPKKKFHYVSEVFPTGKCFVFPGEMAVRMIFLADSLQDQDLMDMVCPMIGSLDSNYRWVGFRLCCGSPKTATQRKTIIQALADKDSDVRGAAEVMLTDDFDRENKVYRTINFTKEECEEIAKVIQKPHIREWLMLES